MTVAEQNVSVLEDHLLKELVLNQLRFNQVKCSQ